MPDQHAAAPTLLFVIGPPAVGKMSVGAAVAERTGFRLFHNHMTIEPLLRLFPFGSPHFARLNDEFRTRILQEAAASDLPGLVFSVVWNFDDPRDADAVDRYAAPDGRTDHLLVDNTDLTPDAVALRAIEHFQLAASATGTDRTDRAEQRP